MSGSKKPSERFDPVTEFMTLRDNLSSTVVRALNLKVDKTTCEFPALEIFETINNEVIVRTQVIEGLDSKSLEVTLEDGVLSISGTVSRDDEVSEDQYFVREIYHGPFARSIKIPAAISSEGIEARVNRHGVVMIRFSRL